MEPSGRNRWQLVADARSAKSVQSSRNRCRRLRPLAAGTPWAVPWREAWPARDRGPPAEQRQRAARPRRPRGVYRVVESRQHPCLGRDRVWLSRSPKASTSTPWTLRGRRQRQPPSTRATERRAKQEESGSPLTDSNRRPPPYHGGALPTELRGRSRHSRRSSQPLSVRVEALAGRRARPLPAPSRFGC